MLPILFEDNHLIAVEKPSGLPSQLTPDGRKGAEDIVRELIEKREGKPGKAFVHVVHRLDTAASGILLLAKTSKALSRLSEAIREKKIQKRYVALVEGTMQVEKNKRFIDYMRHSSRKAAPSDTEGKKAELEIIDSVLLADKTTLLLIELITGRYHQIRFQLSQRGFPIVGDTKYGSQKTYKPGKICLHHAFLSFPHPTLKNEITLHSLPHWNDSVSKQISLFDCLYTHPDR